MLPEIKIIEIFAGAVAGIGLNAVKGKLSAKHNEKKVEKKIKELAESRFRDVFQHLPYSSEISFGGLQDYLNDKLPDEIKTYLFGIDKSERDRCRDDIVSVACQLAHATNEQKRKEVERFICDALNTARSHYTSQLNNKDKIKIAVILDNVEALLSEKMKSLASPPPEIPRYITNPAPRVAREFKYRGDEVDALYAAVKRGQKLALINGLGGIGKTSVAKALYHKIKGEVKHIAWVEYQDNIKDSLLNSFKIFENIENPDAKYREIASFLRHAKTDTVLFIDNVSNDNDAGMEFIGSLDASVVLTSRLDKIGKFEVVPIGFLSEDQCVEIFYEYYEYDQAKAQEGIVRELVGLVKCHTLSVELLARAANRPGYPLDAYLAKLKDEGFDYPDMDVETDNNKNAQTIAEHMKTLFQLVAVSDEQARILKNFALFPSIEIPAEVQRWLACGINDLIRLTKLGWLAKSDTGYYMHPIIQKAIRLQYEEVQYEDFATVIDYMSGEEYIKDTDIYTDVHLRLSIAEAVMSHFCGVEKAEIGMLFNNIAVKYENQGDYAKALEWYQEALEIHKKDLGTDHLITAKTYDNIAGVYYRQGEYDKALEWTQKALEIKEEKLLGIIQPDTATTYSNTGVVYYSQGEYGKSLKWLQKALEIRENVLGTDHPDTAITYNNMALVYDSQGKYDKALEWNQKALEIKEKAFGTDHPSTAITYHNIAGAYDEQNNYDEALEWYQKALAIKAKILGVDHPSTKLTIENMHLTYTAHYGEDSNFDEWLTNQMDSWTHP